MIKSAIIWLFCLIPSLAIELICFLLAPLAACFVITKQRTDTVKRYGKEYRTMPRDYLQKYVYWFQTHDNAVDEWWYGVYNTDHWFAFARAWTQADYDSKRWVRWYCRLMWLWRNPAYGFHYALFSKPKSSLLAWHIKGKEDEGYWHELIVYADSFQLEMHIAGKFVCWLTMLGLVIYVVVVQPQHLTVFYLAALNVSIFRLLENRYLSMNIGWKAHKEMPRLLYANRLIGFKKYEQ